MSKPVIRCSQLDQLFECNGSFTLQQLVAPVDREDSREGLYLHHATAARQVGELGATPPDGGLVGPALPATYKVPVHSDWMVDFFFRLICEEVPRNWALEVEVPLAYEFDRFILSGHQDAFAISPAGTQSMGFDWKTGYRAVDPADSNNQCLGYIVLQKRAYPMLKKARFTIAQPRANEEDGEQRVSTVVVEGDALDNAVTYLERRVNAALDNLGEVNSGPRQCRWCAAVLQCPAAIAERELMKIQLTPESLANIKREPSDATLADWIVSARIIEQGIKDAKELAHERIAACGSIMSRGGVSITQTEQGGSYTITDPVALYSALCATLPTNERAKVIDLSTTRLRDAIARVMNVPKTGKAATTAESVFTERFRPHMEQGKRRIFKFS